MFAFLLFFKPHEDPIQLPTVGWHRVINRLYKCWINKSN